jgi:DNA recombination protein RmuC
VVVSAKRLKEKHIEIGKRDVEEVPLVESAPRYGRPAELPETDTPLLSADAGEDKVVTV